MSISDRIEGTIENWRIKWGDILKGWLVAFLALGLEVFFDVLGKAFAPKLKPFIDTIEKTGKVPPELQPILDEMKTPSGEVAAIFQSSAGYALVGGALGKLIDAIFLPLSYDVNTATRNVILDQISYIALWLRKEITDDDLDQGLAALGVSPESVEQLTKLSEMRLDPGTITRIWLRDKPKWEKYFDDLKHQGWTDDRIEVVKELAKIIPPLADMVRFADYSAFDPEVIARWREFYDAPGWIREPFELLGVTGEWANRYWFSHWVQPGRFELSELHRRDLISDDDVKLAYRTMGYSPYWQEHLLKLVKAVPTRVDVRRWWDMRTIDEARLREIYHAQGYYDKDLDDYVLWTKVYVAFPDLIARFKSGWITEADVRSELTTLGMPIERVEEMMQTKIKPVQPERVINERNLTKTDVYKAIKKEFMSLSEGTEILMDIGFSEDEAILLIETNVGALEGSPESYIEFKRLTQLYRKAIGLEAKIPPPELLDAEAALKEAEADLTRAKGEGLKEEKLAPYQKAVSDAAYRYRQLLLQWQEKKA